MPRLVIENKAFYTVCHKCNVRFYGHTDGAPGPIVCLYNHYQKEHPYEEPVPQETVTTKSQLL